VYLQFSIAGMSRRDVEQVMKDCHYRRMAHIRLTAAGKNAGQSSFVFRQISGIFAPGLKFTLM
jgi:hypothetical protein